MDLLVENISNTALKILETSVGAYAPCIWDVIKDEVISDVLDVTLPDKMACEGDVALAIGSCIAIYIGVEMPTLTKVIGRQIRKMDTVEKWRYHVFSTGVEAGADYLKFQKVAKKELKKKVLSAGFKLLSFNPDHYSFSAVLQDRETLGFVYVSLKDVRWNGDEWFRKVLYRTMNPCETSIGVRNHYCDWNAIGNALADIRNELKDETK